MRLARGLVYLYLLVMPWSLIFFQWSGHDYARMVQVGLAGLCALAVLLSPAQPSSDADRPLRWVLLLMGLATLASVLASPRPDWAWREVALVAGLWSIAAVIGLDPRGRAQMLVDAAAASLAFYCTLELLLVNMGLLQGVAVHAESFLLGYDNHRFFNHVATLALPLCALAVVTSPTRWVRYLGWWGLVSGVALTLMTAGRAVAVADLATCIGLLAWQRRRAWPLLRVWLLGCALGAMLYELQFVVLPGALGLGAAFSWADRVQDGGSVASRWRLWSWALQHWLQSPWLGMGPMHFAHYPNPDTDAAHPHNIYVQLLSEWGLWVFAGAIYLLLRGVRRVDRTLRQAEKTPNAMLGMGLAWALAAALVDGCFSGNFVMPMPQVWIAATAGALWAWMRETFPQATSEPAHRGMTLGRGIAQALVAALCIGLVVTALRDLRQLDALLARSEQISVTARHTARFWSDGWF